MHNNRIEFAPFKDAGPRLRSAVHAERYRAGRSPVYLAG